MKYDFDRVTDRTGTNSVKWDMRREVFGKEDVLPLWVADMDFPVAEPISEALRRRTGHPFYGYTRPGASLLKSIIQRLKSKYNWRVEPEWLVFTPGVIPALAAAIRAFTHPGDSVVIGDPVYHPFWSLIPNAGCRVAASPLKMVGGQYEMDYEDLTRQFALDSSSFLPRPAAKMMILCSPHNPVGRVWTKDELKTAGRIAIDGGAVVVSDEVHCELLFDGVAHTPFASISEEFAQNSMVCMSASKTFNLAGLAASVIIIPNPRLRADFQSARAGIMPQPDIMAFAALEAAFSQGDEWLGQLGAYLQANLDFLTGFIESRIPLIKIVRPQGTYLVWLDCRGLGLGPKELRSFFINQARVGLDDGFVFGSGGEGFQRMNIACPRLILEEALSRIEQAVKTLS
ncbi:cystathionine beta-lyase Bsu PatB [Dehalogenimonas sp. WBC-2]|nr:cystathionine beta-lyase Bsu PatB [Dehalogenimonas sp. WBC-2]